MSGLVTGSAEVSRQIPAEIAVFGRRYWSPELYKYAGWPVHVEFDGDDDGYASVWSEGRQHRLCTVACIGDSGPLDMDREREAAKKAKLDRIEARASIVRWQAKRLVELIDQRIERARVFKTIFGARPITHALGNLRCRIAKALEVVIKRAEHRDLQLLDIDDQSLQLAKAIFEVGHSGLKVVGHQTAPFAEQGTEPNPADPGAHRLCGDGK